jgi:hypothetical protein
MALGLALGILLWTRPVGASESDKPPLTNIAPATADRFVITKSGRVTDARGRAHYHTFLLDDLTGEIWEMFLRSKWDRRVSEDYRRGSPASPGESKEIRQGVGTWAAEFRSPRHEQFCVALEIHFCPKRTKAPEIIRG